ncbi:MAG: recombinase zinc beta ribbon domain-containing protein [Deltaproteobacteria bacterium]|nr:recombinase zinc beta ribbon domain-containing protein [Deltaproteobacteria bacterium]
MRVKGKIYPAKHTPIISREPYDQAQSVRLSWNKKPFKYSDKPFIFRGLIKCAHCGCPITSDLKKGKYIYMYCTKSRGPCEGLRIREEELLEQIKNVFRSFHIPENVLAALKNQLAESVKAKKIFHDEAISRVRKDYDLIHLAGLGFAGL